MVSLTSVMIPFGEENTMTASVSIDMTGRVALVTGGAYGMGRASARRFAAAGASVVVADVDGPRGAETIDLIRSSGGEAVFVETDVSVAAAVEELIARTVETYGRLDYAHNNAGIIEGQQSIVDYPDDQWDRIIANNLTSVFLCMKHEIPVMLRQGGGAIVNVASETIFKGNAGDIAYTASKHGVYGLTTVAGLRYAHRGIRINAIAPGNIDTGITERAREYLTDEQYEAMATRMPNRRLGRPEEVAEIVVWLCSDAAVLVNAARIAADAGWHIA
jgi:NAD(P)-dependent dehydrogenase (short-subunit alcohol dehydrogenase family)